MFIFGTFAGSIGQQQRPNTTCFVGFVEKHLKKSDDCRRDEYAHSLGLEENASVQQILNKRKKESERGMSPKARKNGD